MPIRNAIRNTRRSLTRLTGYTLLGLGCILAISPLPAGAVLIGAGGAILLPLDSGFRRRLRRRRAKWKWLDRSINRIGQLNPRGLGRLLIR
jgi:hypothetical protein